MWNAAQFTWEMQVLVLEIVLPSVFVIMGALALAAPALYARRKMVRVKASAAANPSAATR
jgi:hypothetical protein